MLTGCSTVFGDRLQRFTVDLLERSRVSRQLCYCFEPHPLTRKFPCILDGVQVRPSVHRLMPLSSTQKQNTAPDRIIVSRSESFNRLATRGIIPLLSSRQMLNNRNFSFRSMLTSLLELCARHRRWSRLRLRMDALLQELLRARCSVGSAWLL